MTMVKMDADVIASAQASVGASGPPGFPFDRRLPCTIRVLVALEPAIDAERRDATLARLRELVKATSDIALASWPEIYGRTVPGIFENYASIEELRDYDVVAMGHAFSQREKLVTWAMQRDIPVLLLNEDGFSIVELSNEEDREYFLLSGADDAVTRADGDPQRLAQIVLAPRPSTQRAQLAAYIAEGEPGKSSRVEYDLLLSLLASAEKERSVEAPATSPAALAREERADYIAFLDQAAENASAHASHYGECWRSIVVTRSFLLLLPVFVSGIIGVLVPQVTIVTIPLQILITLVIFWDRRQAAKGFWQRKWIEYRGLAERLRCLRFLVMVDAQPPWQDEAPGSWIDWYVARLASAAPASRAEPGTEAALLAYVLNVEVAGQINYHRNAVRRYLALDKRLRRLGRWSLLGAAALGVGLFCVGLLQRGVAGVPWMSLTSIALTVAPSLLAGINAFRSEFDIARQIERSARALNSLTRLRQVAQRLQPTSVQQIARRAAEIMTDDVAGWRTTLESRNSRLSRR